MMKVLTPRTLEMSLQRAPIPYYDNLKLLFYILFYLTDCFFYLFNSLLFLPHKMLSYYIRDIYVSFSNTGYKTSEIYIESYVKDYKCRTLQKTMSSDSCVEMWGPPRFWLLWWRFLTTRTLEMLLQRAPLSTILYYDDWNLLFYILLYFHDYFYLFIS